MAILKIARKPLQLLYLLSRMTEKKESNPLGILSSSCWPCKYSKICLETLARIVDKKSLDHRPVRQQRAKLVFGGAGGGAV